MSRATHIIGIDLGTTNCAVAFVELARGASAPVSDLPIPQLLRPGEVSTQLLLPSCIYLPGDHELPPGSTSLPWDDASAGLPSQPGRAAPVIGEFARWQGARVPGRLVASAKSWLCHPGVDRSAPILPWGAPPELAKISPVEASARILAHLSSAWNLAHPDAPIAGQDVVVTVPASFDEVARALTVNAARRAGLESFTLLEEPQAAFYDFTARHRLDLSAALKDIRLVLVVDIGGGTTDFSLIQVTGSTEGIALRRLAVGDHLMLGGDNMDAALARSVEETWTLGGRKLNATQWTQLVQIVRSAKESLLSIDSPEKYGVALASEGSRLLGGTLSAEIKRSDAARLILEGFFPDCTAQDTPRRAARVALQELGLPYAQDPSITRHLAAFLRLHATAGFAALEQIENPGSLPRPDALLLNGGVFNSPKISEQLMKVVSSWWPGSPPVPLLAHSSLELAVARGAAYYGLIRRGMGKRISGGTARAFYVGLAVDKAASSPRAVCLIPRGHEEGRTVDLQSQPFTLSLGHPVRFPLYSTTSDRIDRPGDVIELSEDFQALPPIHTVFKGADDTSMAPTVPSPLKAASPHAAERTQTNTSSPVAAKGGARKPNAVPVSLQATLTELGTLELWCVSNTTGERWRLEFELRAGAPDGGTAATEAMPAHFKDASNILDRVYGPQSAATEPKAAKQLVRSMETAIGPRETWRLSLLRALWAGLNNGAKRRRRSADHERVFYQLFGYCLRPGFGYPLDEWRCEQTFRLFTEGVTHQGENSVWNEFWVLWRRIAGGLGEARQKELWNFLQPHLAWRVPPVPPKNGVKPKGPRPEGLDEMIRAAASLEHLDPPEKIALGNWIIERMKNPEKAAGPWAWSLGRLGARELIYGSGHKTVPAGQAEEWLSLLLDLGIGTVDNGAFAAVQLARLTGDRARDLDETIRAKTIDALQAAHAPEHWLRLVTEVTALEAEDEARALGDTLPLGLQLGS